jgi:hypothetical protein
MKKQKFDVLSPDGFSIHPTDTYKTIDKAKEALKEWAERYNSQGYYSSNRRGRIALSDLPSHCRIIEVEV